MSQSQDNALFQLVYNAILSVQALRTLDIEKVRDAGYAIAGRTAPLDDARLRNIVDEAIDFGLTARACCAKRGITISPVGISGVD